MGYSTYKIQDLLWAACYLERLIIDAPPDFNAVLRSIQALVLQYLYLRSTEPPLNHPHNGTGEALLQFSSSKPPMKLLELHDVDIRRDDFVQCFLPLPLLEELRHHETEISNDALLSTSWTRAHRCMPSSEAS